MPTKMNRLPVRTSAALRSVIDQAGPVNAATRALLWLGADAAGLTIPAAGRREIAALLIEEGLTTSVLAALQQLYDRLAGNQGGDTPDDIPYATTYGATKSVMPAVPAVPQPERPAAVRNEEAARDDPFADVGLEFEE